MNQKLQNILEIIRQSEKLDAEQKDNLVKAVKDADKEFEITAFKLERTEKVKKTTAILLEETIEELEQKRKAVEDQNRELEIEASLERVRAVAMGMNRPDDLLNICEVLFREFISLGFSELRNSMINIHNDDQKTFLNYDYSDEIGKSITPLDYNTHPVMEKQIKQSRAANDAFSEAVYKGKDLEEWKEFRRKYGEKDDPRIKNITALYYYFYSIGKGTIGISTFSPINKEKLTLLKRFRNVFSLAYKRYSDIALAEAQAREAKIEVSLERIRSRALGMHHSSEVKEVSNLLFSELKKMDINLSGFNIIVFDKNRDSFEMWRAKQVAIPNEFESFSHKNMYDKLNHYLPGFVDEFESEWKSGKPYYMSRFTGEKRIAFLKANSEIYNYSDEQLEKMKELYTDPIQWYMVFFKQGWLGLICNENLSESELLVSHRFAEVFEFAYTRFLDIQKAEAQAREAKIETALEKVRAKAMAMHSSLDFADTVDTFFSALNSLNVMPHRCGVGIIDPETRIVDINATTATQEKEIKKITGKLKLSDHPVLDGIFENWILQKEYHPVLHGKEILEYYKVMNPQVEFPDFAGDEIQYGYYFFFKEGGVFAWTEKELSVEDLNIFRRYTSVLSLTYRRYLDLREAETRAVEALKQTSLDRVRAEIASMRTTEDLNRITPIIWRELKTLEVPFIRCGVFIIDEDKSETKVYLTTPDGKSLGVLNLSFDANELTSNTVEHWRKKQIYKEHWNKEEFINWTKSMMNLGQVQNAETYQGSSVPPESLYLHFVPFAQGMLYVGDVSPLTDEKLDLVKTLAEAFSIAYARYEDFKNLEEAKNKIETTLSELKSTQAQLIHAEKLASLGELTAGIAHEIKNPLNFVNNFSELSKELLDEIKTELENNNKEEILAILNDLKLNLEKINEHGRRADSIVKGMLLHSRGSSGEKTLTDINDLLEQYVNLAYHGMRAQNKEFNISIEKDYDESLEKINVIPQDISRVFLNIINNACYAANDRKKKSRDGNFSPTLKVSTKQLNGKIEIKIGDNGNGIPEDILDKIFQPFFTTKPTGEGTGLGLSLSYDIVTKVHGGELKVKSRLGEGTNFTISLPFRQSNETY